MELWLTILSFLLVIIIINRTHNLGYALFAGTFVLGAFGRIPGERLMALIWQNATAPTTIRMIVVILLIGVLGKVMGEVGLLERLVNSLEKLVADARYSLILLPSLIGLLPVLGGAALSAPLIHRTGQRIGFSNDHLAAINLFYRHIWFLIFPLYPSLIVAESISGFSVFSYIKLQFLPALIILPISFIWFFPKANSVPYKTDVKLDQTGAGKDFFFSILPILVMLLLAIVLKLDFSLALLVGVAIALGSNLPQQNGYLNRAKAYLHRGVRLVKTGLNWRMGLVIVLIMLFQAFVEEVGGVNIFAEQMTQWGVPLMAIACLIAFITGYTTGANMAAIAASFVIFIPIIPGGEQAIFYLSMMFVYSLVGYILSPLHLCLVLTNEYYGASYATVFNKLVVPCLILLAAMTGLIYFLM